MYGFKNGLKKTIVILMIVLSFTFVLPIIGNGYQAQAKVVKTITLNYSLITMNKGYAMKLKISGTKSKVKWTSSNKKVATVSNKGNVKGKKIGRCTVTAKVDGIKLRCKVKVNPSNKVKERKADYSSTVLNLSSLKLDVARVKYDEEGTVTLNVGKSTYTLKLLNNKKSVKWHSSNEKIAKVDKKGKILAVNKGTCKVIATAGGKNYTCNVTVTDYNDDKMIYEQYNVYTMVGMMNVDRVKAKSRPLKVSETLNKAADTRAAEIEKSFSHIRTNGKSFSTIFTQYGFRLNGYVAENISLYEDTIDNTIGVAKLSYKNIYNSRGHRENILNPNYEYVGIGTNVVTYEEDGFVYSDTYITQEFFRN